MCYADAGYIFALLKSQQGSFSKNAEKISRKLEDQDLETTASEGVLLELLFLAHNKNLDPIRFIRNSISIANFENIKEKTALEAAFYMKVYGTKPADSLHIAHSVEDEARLITSDRKIKDTLKRIPNSPEFINMRSPNPIV